MERIYIDLPNHWAVSGETIWAERLHHDLYWVASIPFYADGGQ